MPLYLVKVTFTLPVEAESEEAAEQDALEDWAHEEIRTNGFSESASVSARPMGAGGEWGNCLPWGGDGERTINEILDATPFPEKPTPPAPQVLGKEGE